MPISNRVRAALLHSSWCNAEKEEGRRCPSIRRPVSRRFAIEGPATVHVGYDGLIGMRTRGSNPISFGGFTDGRSLCGRGGPALCRTWCAVIVSTGRGIFLEQLSSSFLQGIGKATRCLGLTDKTGLSAACQGGAGTVAHDVMTFGTTEWVPTRMVLWPQRVRRATTSRT